MKMAKLFANSGDPDQMSHSAMSDLDLHYLPILGLKIKWVKQKGNSFPIGEVTSNAPVICSPGTVGAGE